MAYEIKTKRNEDSVDDFINSVSDEQRKKDSLEILKLMRKWTGEKGKMYGSSIVGFVNYSYETKSGCNGEWFALGFSPRKGYLALYIVPYLDETEELLKKVGKAKLGRCCINAKKLSDLDIKIVEKLVKLSIKAAKEKRIMAQN